MLAKWQELTARWVNTSETGCERGGLEEAPAVHGGGMVAVWGASVNAESLLGSDGVLDAQAGETAEIPIGSTKRSAVLHSQRREMGVRNQWSTRLGLGQ